MENGRQMYNTSFLCGKFCAEFHNGINSIELKHQSHSMLHIYYYFFQLFSTDSKQNGADHEGIDGFLVKDIDYLAKLYSKTHLLLLQ